MVVVSNCDCAIEESFTRGRLVSRIGASGMNRREADPANPLGLIRCHPFLSRAEPQSTASIGVRKTQPIDGAFPKVPLFGNHQ
jgi:hypothetical protein